MCHNLIVRSEELSRNARECLQLGERPTEPDVKKSLIELSIWMEAALSGIYLTNALPMQLRSKPSSGFALDWLFWFPEFEKLV